MRIKNSIFLLLLCTIMTFFVGCGEDKNMANDKASLDDISSAITDKIKTNLINTGAAIEEDFKDGILPSYSVMRLGDDDFYLPIEYDSSKLEDALVITHSMNVKSDMIVVLKAKSDADIPELENYVKKLRDEQYKTWETYLPDQFEKVQQNMTKTIGRYVIYVTYDEPQSISEAVENLLK